MKLLDKKRIKVKKGELLALNERNMLAKVSVEKGQNSDITLPSFLRSFLSLSLPLSSSNR